MRTWTRLLLAALALSSAAVLSAPVPEDETELQVDEQAVQAAREQLVKRLESDIARASLARAAARAVRMEQQFEDDILREAVQRLREDRGNRGKALEDARHIGELIQRDKRAVDLLSGLLGNAGAGAQVGATASAGGGAGASASAGGGSDSGSILQLLPSLLGSSSGDSPDGGGGFGSGTILQVLPSLLSSSSGSGDDASGGGGGGSDSGSILQLLPGLLGASSGGDSEDGGGGSNILGLVSGLLGASSGGDSSGGAGAGSGSFLSGLFGSSGGVAQAGPPPAPGTYEDLIGKGISGYDPVYVLSNSVAGALRAKFSVFKTLVTNLVGGLLGGIGGSSSGGGSSGGGAGAGVGAGASIGGTGAGAGATAGGTISLGGGYP